MALAVDASSPAKATANLAAVTTASFTAPAGSLLCVLLAYNTPGTDGQNCTVTDSGGLTWALVARKSKDAGSLGGAGTEGGVEIWTAVPGSSAARTVTATSGGTGNFHKTLVLKVFTDTGTPTTGAVAASFSASGLPSASLTTTAANSWVWSVSSDWSDKALGTAGSAQTMDTADEHDFGGGALCTHVWRQTATTPSASTSVTNNLTAIAGQDYDMLIVEILAAAGGPPPSLMFLRPVQSPATLSR
jgi:hypothetical protein